MLSLLYIGPGLGLGTIILVLLVLLIVLASFLMILWIPLKKSLRWISGKLLRIRS